MGKLIFEGDTKVLETIAKTNRQRVRKYDLKMSLEEDKQPKPKAKAANKKSNTKK